VYGNFRPSLEERYARAARKPRQSWTKARDWRAARSGMAPEHLDMVRACTCCLCHVKRGVEAHHLKQGAALAERGVFLRATDRWAVPLCRHHHRDLESVGSRNELAWFARYGVEPISLAVSLWNARGDLSKMGLVIVGHKQLATRVLRREAIVASLTAQGLTRNEAEEQYASGMWRRA